MTKEMLSPSPIANRYKFTSAIPGSRVKSGCSIIESSDTKKKKGRGRRARRGEQE
jgi:hypothetical protein